MCVGDAGVLWERQSTSLALNHVISLNDGGVCQSIYRSILQLGYVLLSMVFGIWLS